MGWRIRWRDRTHHPTGEVGKPQTWMGDDGIEPTDESALEHVARASQYGFVAEMAAISIYDYSVILTHQRWDKP